MFDLQKFNQWVWGNGWSMKQLAKAVGMSEPTLHRKKNGESDFTRYEINRMIDLIGCDDPMAIFFAPNLAETQEQNHEGE